LTWDVTLVGVGDGLVVGVTEAGFASATPLSQTNFFPFLIHVNFFVGVELIEPAFGHAAPAEGEAAEAVVIVSESATSRTEARQIIFFTP
jgi:hypothetical protein